MIVISYVGIGFRDSLALKWVSSKAFKVEILLPIISTMRFTDLESLR